MFANFFGIVIISVSALLIAGLALRSTSDLPATMNLGLVDNLASTASPAAPTSSPDPESVTNDAEVDSTNTSAVGSTDTSAATNTEDSTNTNDIAPAKVDAVDNAAAQNAKPTAVPRGLSKEYLEIRRRAIENSETAHTRTNKSDSINYKGQQLITNEPKEQQ